MPIKDKKIDPAEHKILGVILFNATWNLIDKKNRTKEEDDEMIHSAHASRYHWGVAIKGNVSGAEPVNYARGDWQLSYVYSILGKFEPALYYGQRSLDTCLDNEIGDFDLAFGYEAVARALSLNSEKKKEFQIALEKAKEAGDKISKKEDKEYFLSQMKSIKNQ